MKAIRIQSTGGPEVLRLEEVPAPVAGPGQVVVKIAAVTAMAMLMIAAAIITSMSVTPRAERLACIWSLRENR